MQTRCRDRAGILLVAERAAAIVGLVMVRLVGLTRAESEYVTLATEPVPHREPGPASAAGSFPEAQANYSSGQST